MYSMDFFEQLDQVGRRLWGAGCVDTQAAAEEASRRAYFPPENIKVLECYKDSNGEWVPHPSKSAQGELEKEVSS